LKKRTSINSHDSQLHKEKEMADFRKWFLAFAVLALLSSFAVPASAQITPALQCVANAGVPPTVRAEGLTELVGDVVLNCNGGTPTPFGQVVPQANVTIFLSTNITSRLTASPFSEALLMIDEPHSPSNPTVPLQLCDPGNLTAGVCSITGTTTPGIGTYNGSSASRPNVFQGRQTGVNQITFFGIPIDPPGTTGGTRIIRVTNVRGNANQLGVSSTLVPTQITEYISITGSTSVPVNNPQQTVAFVQPGLVSSVRSAVTFVQCLDANGSIAKDPTAALGTGGQNGQQFLVRFDEGFGTAWKVRNINQVLNPATATTVTDVNQNVPGAIYNTEAGFQNNTVDPNPNPPGSTGAGIVSSASNSSQFSASARGLNTAGVASQGTRLYMNFGTVPNGSQIFVPIKVSITAPITGATTGYAVLVSTDANGALPSGGPPSLAGGNTAGLAPVSVSSGTGLAVYEVMQSDPFSLERMQVPVAVAFVSNSGNNLPAPGVQSTISAGFAPLSNVGTASDTAPIPRFAPSTTPRNSFNVVKCSCNILFPFVSNQQGFDTGVAISNTSVDPFGTTPQTGTVTLNYYSGGTPPPAQTTNATVPAGQQVLFTLSGGGNFGIAATPGFQGYIIAQAQFQFCHAFAYISAQGALPTAPGASEGYLGIILDAPGLNRTLQIGEVQAH
jgi:hypothetical protein